MMKRTPAQWVRFYFYWIVRAIAIGMIAYAIVRLAISKPGRRYSNYIFIIIQASCLVLLSVIPSILRKKAKIQTPLVIEFIFLTFASCAILLGELAEFYIKFSWWDDVLHTISGSFIAAIGFVLVNSLNQKKDVEMKLAPGFVVLFVFCLALASGVVWEIIEWTADGLAGSNMQRFRENTTDIIAKGEGYVGRNALRDTMHDLIEATIGAIIMCVLGYVDMKRSKKSHFGYFKVIKIETVKSSRMKKIQKLSEDNKQEDDSVNKDVSQKD